MFLLIFSTLLDYYTGLKIHNAQNKTKKSTWLRLSIIVNLGFLGVFKYYNFFVTSFADSLYFIGFEPNYNTLKIILPVGISFYTFHGLSYVIDIYKSRINPEKNVINYSVFVCFFPLLVAGPIERATHLLPQIIKRREFDYIKAIDGLKQILWGLFKKIVIADNCAKFANEIFNNSENYSGSTLVIGAIFFTFQIYGDFSGYSDIALGVARLFGFELLKNFAFPYFSRDIAEFWRRWHISLSSWFKDYVYIPLGGSKGGIWIKIRNIFIIFLLSGFWHGANWTFIAWGFVNALYIMPSIVFKTNRNNLEIVAKGKILPSIKDIISISTTFSLTVIAWIFFRSNNISHAMHFISQIASNSLFTRPNFLGSENVFPIFVLTFAFFCIEWIGRENNYAIATLGSSWPKPFRWALYISLICFILFLNGAQQEFIYFQF